MKASAALPAFSTLMATLVIGCRSGSNPSGGRRSGRPCPSQHRLLDDFRVLLRRCENEAASSYLVARGRRTVLSRLAGDRDPPADGRAGLTLLVLGLLGLVSDRGRAPDHLRRPPSSSCPCDLRVRDGLLVWSEGWKPGRRWQEAGYLLGLATVCGCCVWRSRFPDPTPCWWLGTGLRSVRIAPSSSILLDNRIARGIGLIATPPTSMLLENHWHGVSSHSAVARLGWSEKPRPSPGGKSRRGVRCSNFYAGESGADAGAVPRRPS